MYIPGQSFNPYEVAPIMGARSNVMPFSTFVEPTAVAPAAPPIMGTQQLSSAPALASAPTASAAEMPSTWQGQDMGLPFGWWKDVRNPYTAPALASNKSNIAPTAQVPVTQRPGLAGDFESVAELRGLLDPELAYRRGDPSRTLSAQNVSSIYSKPSLNPSLDYVMRGDQQGYYFVTNKGKAAKTKASKSGFIPLNPNWQYRIVNERGKNQVVASGTGEQGLQDVYSTAQRLSAEQGKKANWKVEVFDPSVGSWKVYADDDPPGSDLGVAGKILGTALPLATLAIPGLNVASTIALGTALGGAGAAIAGRDPLKGAVMGGLSSAGGQILGPALGRGLDIGSQAAGAIGTGIGATVGGVATGQSIEDALKGGALSGLSSYAAGSLANELRAQNTSGGGGGGGGSSRAPIITDTGMTLFGSAPTQVSLPVSMGSSRTTEPSSQEGEPIIVGRPTPAALGVNPLNPFYDPTADIVSPSTLTEQLPSEDGEPIIVRGEPENLLPGTSYANVFPSSGGAETPYYEGVLDEYYGLEENKQGGIDLSKLGLSDWLNIAGLATGTLGNLFGGGGGGGGLSRIPAGLFGGGGGGGAFGSTLPAANMPGLTAAPGGTYARQDLSDVDWATYGERPELSMFSYVPRPGEGPMPSAADLQDSIQPSPTAPPIMNEDDGRMARGGLVGYGGGGEVNGPGDGREDLIPAMLSDGEYVIDAETVALLGNGSSKAGADALDRFRVNLRKHKGKQLARGGFSSDAKSPMHYLNGAAG